MNVQKIVVTGSSGKLGQWVVRRLVENGLTVTCVDQVPTPAHGQPTRLINLCQLGEVYDVLAGQDAIIHLANIPTAFLYANDRTFANNVQATYNVYEAAAGLGIRKMVMASSECAYGIGFARDLRTPDYLPLDENHPMRPEDCYGLSKMMGEQIAESFWLRSRIATVALRFGYIHLPEQIELFGQYNTNPQYRIRNLWNYLDVRDAAAACHLALKADVEGCCPLNIVADDTGMQIPSADLVREIFPTLTDIRAPLDGYTPLMSNRKAAEVIGWRPQHAWQRPGTAD